MLPRWESGAGQSELPGLRFLIRLHCHALDDRRLTSDRLCGALHSGVVKEIGQMFFKLWVHHFLAKSCLANLLFFSEISTKNLSLNIVNVIFLSYSLFANGLYTIMFYLIVKCVIL